MEFNEAQDARTGKIIVLKDIENSDNLEELRDNLLCPTEECDARLTYVSLNNPNKKAYLKTHDKSEHISTCIHKKENIESRRKNSQHEQLVNLSVEGTKSRLTGPDVKKIIFGTKTKKENSTHRKRKYTSKNETTTNSSSVKLTASATRVENSDRNLGKNKSPRMHLKTLNELTSNDKGSSFKIPVQAVQAKRLEDKKYEFTIKDINDDVQGKLLLGYEFFERNIQGLDKQLDLLVTYINSGENNIVLSIFGTLLDYQKKKIEVYQDYHLYIFLPNLNKKIYTLAEFNYYYNK